MHPVTIAAWAKHMAATVVARGGRLGASRIAAQDLSKQIAAVNCDIMTGTLPEGHDVVLVARRRLLD